MDIIIMLNQKRLNYTSITNTPQFPLEFDPEVYKKS